MEQKDWRIYSHQALKERCTELGSGDFLIDRLVRDGFQPAETSSTHPHSKKDETPR